MNGQLKIDLTHLTHVLCPPPPPSSFGLEQGFTTVLNKKEKDRICASFSFALGTFAIICALNLIYKCNTI